MKGEEGGGEGPTAVVPGQGVAGPEVGRAGMGSSSCVPRFSLLAGGFGDDQINNPSINQSRAGTEMCGLW